MNYFYLFANLVQILGVSVEFKLGKVSASQNILIDCRTFRM